MKLLTSLILCASLAAPILAQDAPKPEKTQEELLKELHELMDKTSKEMERAEKKLADASRDKVKDDVVAAIIKKFQDELKNGEVNDIPDGFRKYLKENKKELAEQFGLSEDEVEALANSDDKELKDWVKTNHKALSKEFESEFSLKELIIHQNSVENNLEDVLDSQADASEKATENSGKAIEAAHNLAASGKSGKSDSVDNNNKKNEGKPKQESSQQSSTQGNSNNEQHKVNGSSNDELDAPPARASDSNGFRAESNKKVTDSGESSEDHREPSKYKGFREAWHKALKKKIDDGKASEKAAEK